MYTFTRPLCALFIPIWESGPRGRVVRKLPSGPFGRKHILVIFSCQNACDCRNIVVHEIVTITST